MPVDIGSLIVSTSGIVGGRPHIAGTRISVRTIAIWYKHGSTPEEIADQYDHLNLARVYTALAYYQANQDDIEADIADEEALYEKLATENQQTLKTA